MGNVLGPHKKQYNPERDSYSVSISKMRKLRLCVCMCVCVSGV